MVIDLRAAYEAILPLVDKPARYLGGERGAVHKDLRKVSLRFALAFPEVYEIAQSHLGLQILYDLLNRRPETYAERVYAPWKDMERLLREQGLPLASLETCSPLRDFHIIGFSLQYELTYTNILMMLDLAGIPLFSPERNETDPLIIAGGPCAFHPEPLADFIDAFLLGDGEEAVFDICETYLSWDRQDRKTLLRALSTIPGVYVPSLFTVDYQPDGTLAAIRPLEPGYERIDKRFLRDLNAVPLLDRQVVPNLNIVHDRVSLEVMRGCVRGCRFCQAGYIYRPLRERDPQALLTQVQKLIDKSGYDEVSLLSLSTGDYSCVNPLLSEIMNRFSTQKVAVSLPSTRVDALSPHILEEIRRVRKTGFTLAPEAGTQRLRDVIQKEYKEEELVESARLLFSLGWQSVKLYFMLGLPSETEEDLLGIVNLCRQVAKAGNYKCQVTASVSTFVPKPHTPFQWAPQLTLTETESRQAFLRQELRKARIQFKWHDSRLSFLEGIFARGDRSLSSLLLAAYRLGCCFDGWTEECQFDLWQRALAETQTNPNFYLRRRILDEVLPWDHLDSGVTKKFLQRELAKAFAATLTPDCSVERCTYCGACDFKSTRNVTYHLKGAKGGEHRGKEVSAWAEEVMPEGQSWGTRQWQSLHGPKPEAPPSAEATSDKNSTLSPYPANLKPQTSDSAAKASGNAEEWLTGDSNTIALTNSGGEKVVIRLRLKYTKLGPARFVGMRELVTLWGRACQRAHLPIAYSQGYHPLPRIDFGPALPFGVESQEETCDINLKEPLPATAVATSLNEELPTGFAVVAVEKVPLTSPSVETSIRGFRYEIATASLPAEKQSTAWLATRIAHFHALPSYPMQKQGKKGAKTVDAHRFTTALTLANLSTIEVETAMLKEGTLKPHEIISTLLELSTEEMKRLRVTKTKTIFHDEEGAIPAAKTAELFLPTPLR